ncbi:MAG TPA: M28 family peptidase [Clostridia bacterium]|nr:M28 family peptidase [Clostridia bacterium]
MEEVDLMTLSKILVNEINMENVAEHIKWLTENTPFRLSGYGQDKIAAEYVWGRLKQYGLDADIQEFYSYVSRQVSSELRVIYPDTAIIDSIPCCHIASTAPEGIETELVYIGAGAYEDYADKDVKGKVVLLTVSYSPATPEKARIAKDMGAEGIIAMNWGNDESVIANRALKSVWGNPTTKTFGDIPQIAGLGITRKSGEYLKGLCSKNGTVKIRYKAVATREWKKLYQPVGIIRGRLEPEKFILVGGHLDAWQPGVTCNATGNAAMLEIARLFSKHKDKLNRSICFAFFNGHEVAEAAGSTWLLDNYWEDFRDNCIAYMNIDSPGLKGTELFESKVSREVSGFIEKIEKEALKVPLKMSYLTKIGDQSFFGLGVTSLASRSSYTQEYIRAANGASLGFWNHTKEDNYEKYDVDKLKMDIEINMIDLESIVNCGILPFDYTVNLEYILDKLNFIKDESKDILKLDKLISKTEELKNGIEKLNSITSSSEPDNHVKKINEVLMKLSRYLTAPFYTNCDRYSQDPYGLTILSKPVPALYRAIELSKLEENCTDYFLLQTELIRNRNRISDAIEASLSTVKELLETLAFKEDRA